MWISADARDDQRHEHGQLVQLERRVDAQAADRHPLPVRLDDGLVQVRAEHAEEVDERQDERQRDDMVRGLVRPRVGMILRAGATNADSAVDDEAEQGQQRDCPEERWLEVVHATTAAG
jgi:hypothetical protein